MSNFSRSWFQPFVWFFVIGFAFYYPYIWVEIIKSNYSDNFGLFLNPFVRQEANIFKEFYTWWLLHKVISGFVIYHFIIALRRQTKR